MNQRSKRSSDRRNNIGQISVGNSAHPARQHVRGAGADVVIPPAKATGDIKNKMVNKLKGLAQASPLFKKVETAELSSKEEEKKVIAKSTVEEKTKEDKAN